MNETLLMKEAEKLDIRIEKAYSHLKELQAEQMELNNKEITMQMFLENCKVQQKIDTVKSYIRILEKDLEKLFN